jgi:hypothetical protein
MDIGVDVTKSSEQQEAIAASVREFIDMKYELSLYLDDGLIEIGRRFDKALEDLIAAADISALVNR